MDYRNTACVVLSSCVGALTMEHPICVVLCTCYSKQLRPLRLSIAVHSDQVFKSSLNGFVQNFLRIVVAVADVHGIYDCSGCGSA